jgi:hypothetical protein
VTLGRGASRGVYTYTGIRFLYYDFKNFTTITIFSLSLVDGENGIEYDEEPPATPTSPTSQGSGRSSVPRTSSGTLTNQNQGKKKVFFKKVSLRLSSPVYCDA